MKITVWDVTNNKCNIRDYMNVDEKTGRIYVQMEHMDTVLIDRTKEWEGLEKELLSVKNENEVYRKALGFYAEYDIYEWETYYNPRQQMDCIVLDDGGHMARNALGESE